jgi:hypothetical protein
VNAIREAARRRCLPRDVDDVAGLERVHACRAGAARQERKDARAAADIEND